jgi:hypothetical protein
MMRVSNCVNEGGNDSRPHAPVPCYRDSLIRQTKNGRTGAIGNRTASDGRFVFPRSTSPAAL